MKKITVKLEDMREEVFVGNFIEIEDGFLHFKKDGDAVGSVRESLVQIVRMEEMEDETNNIKDEVELAIYENNKEWRKCFWKFETFLKWAGSDWIIGDYKKHFKHMMK